MQCNALLCLKRVAGCPYAGGDDGFCQTALNTERCLYDEGDCCDDMAICECSGPGCFCNTDATQHCKREFCIAVHCKQNALKSLAFCITGKVCNGDHDEIDDDVCNTELNVEECNYDGGDCCDATAECDCTGAECFCNTDALQYCKSYNYSTVS